MLFPHQAVPYWRVWPVKRRDDGMINRVKGWVLAATVLLCAQAGAANLSDIQVSNGESQARITFSFMGDFTARQPQRGAGYQADRRDPGATAAVQR